MTHTRIQATEGDSRFRVEVQSLLQSAKHHIVVISGELGSYDFPELRDAAHAAAARGVKIDVYASEPRIEVVQRLRDAGAHVVVGPIRSRDHFLAVDDARVIVSLKHGRQGPTKSGTREGTANHADDIARARGVDFYFKFLRGFAQGRPPLQLVREVLERYSSDPAAFAGIPIGDDLLGVLGVPQTSLESLTREVIERGRLLGLVSAASAANKESGMIAQNGLMLLSLFIATSIGMELPLTPAVTGGIYETRDVERAYRLIRTPLKVEPVPIQNDT